MCWEKSLFCPEAAEFSDFGVGLQSAVGLLGSLFSQVWLVILIFHRAQRLSHEQDLTTSCSAAGTKLCWSRR